MPSKVCNKVGCNELIPFTDAYCEKHLVVNDDQRKERYRQYSKARYDNDPTVMRFYNSVAWKNVRNNVMREWDYTCAMCWERDGIYTKANVVDHIIEVKDDWDKRLDKDNLEPLCNSCHRIKTYNEQLKRSKK